MEYLFAFSLCREEKEMKTIYSTTASEWLHNRLGKNIRLGIGEVTCIETRLIAYNDETIIIETDGIETLVFRHSIHYIKDLKA